MKKILLSAAFVIAALTGANAQQTISFEASEGYSLGDINTQNNWTVTGAGAGAFISNQEVSNELASDGDYSLKIAKDPAFGWQSVNNAGEVGNPIMGAFYNYTTPVEFETAVISADIYISDVIGNASDYRFGTVNMTAGFFTTIFNFSFNGSIWVLSNDAGVILEDITWASNTWYNVRIEKSANMVSYYIDNVLVHEGALGVNQQHDIEQVRFAHDNYSAEGFAYFDNFKTNDEDDASTGNFASSTFSVYPNPAKDVINVANSADTIENVTITDMNGRVVKQVALGVNEGQINISDLSQGVYILNATSNGKSVTEKIVKQ